MFQLLFVCLLQLFPFLFVRCSVPIRQLHFFNHLDCSLFLFAFPVSLKKFITNSIYKFCFVTFLSDLVHIPTGGAKTDDFLKRMLKVHVSTNLNESHISCVEHT
jgi:hypothetical protein